MKVNVYGNVLNLGYNFTIQLRNKGIDATLFIDNASPLNQDFPWWEDSTLSRDNLPSWIKYYDVNPFFMFPGKKTKTLIRDFKDCDVALVSCWGPLLAKKAKVKYIFYSLGGDLNCINIKDDFKSLIYASMPFLSRCKKLIKILFFSVSQRSSLKNYAKSIIVCMGYQEKPFIAKYGLWHKTIRGRNVWDVDKYHNPPDQKSAEIYKKYDLVFFMPCRHSWYSLWNDPKGNDKFIRAYADFLKGSKSKTILVCIEKGIDVYKSKLLIKDLNIEDNVEWVSEMNKDGIRNYESLKNVVVVDQFGHDKWLNRFPTEDGKIRIGFGFSGLEALSAGRILITAFSDQEYYENNTPPILSAYTETEIYDRLMQLSAMSLEERNEMAGKGYEFVKKWHGKSNIDLFINELQKTASS